MSFLLDTVAVFVGIPLFFGCGGLFEFSEMDVFDINSTGKDLTLPTCQRANSSRPASN